MRVRALTVLNNLRLRLGLAFVANESFVLETKKPSGPQQDLDDVDEDEAEDSQESESKGKTWNELLSWTNRKDLADEFIEKVTRVIPTVVGQPHGPFYRIYADMPISGGNFLLVIILNKDSIRICLKAGPDTLDDPKDISYQVKGWFFNEERRFRVTDDTIDYAVGLVKQAFDKIERVPELLERSQ